MMTNAVDGCTLRHCSPRLSTLGRSSVGILLYYSALCSNPPRGTSSSRHLISILQGRQCVSAQSTSNLALLKEERTEYISYTLRVPGPTGTLESGSLAMKGIQIVMVAIPLIVTGSEVASRKRIMGVGVTRSCKSQRELLRLHVHSPTIMFL